MDSQRIDLIICFAVTGLVGNGRTVVFNLPFAKHYIELRADKMLKHNTNIIRSGTSFFQIARLVNEVVYVGAY